MAVWNRVQEYGEHVPHPLVRLRRVLSRASGILIMDGKFVRILGKSHCLHVAYDTAVGVVNYALDDSENATGYAVMMNLLKKEGYKPLAVVSDGHWGIRTVAQDWNLPHQRCVFHLLRELKKMLVVRGELYGASQVLYSRMKGIWKAKTLEIMADRVNQLRKISFCFHGKRHREALRWFWNHLHDATLHFSFGGTVPRTSNDLERLNGQIEARIKTMRGVKSKASLRNLIKILFYFRDYK
ncbi:MAG: transposase [bacterium]|nr:transposase [bacterium]